MTKTPKETLLEQERFELKPKSGGGLLSYEVWGYQEQGRTVVTRYNLAYVNHAIHRGDNGRVLGFDNAHGYHHRHYMGKVTPVEFESYEATLGRFQQEWLAIVKSAGGK
ncbi:MAG: transcriptional regulator [Rhodoferax sp.]|nr:transcriptional regulator [Rhodoferax sp.]